MKHWQEERAPDPWEAPAAPVQRPGRATSQQHHFWGQQVCGPRPFPQQQPQHCTQLSTPSSRTRPPQPVPFLLPQNSLPSLRPSGLLLSRLPCRSLPSPDSLGLRPQLSIPSSHILIGSLSVFLSTVLDTLQHTLESMNWSRLLYGVPSASSHEHTHSTKQRFPTLLFPDTSST